MRRTVTEGMHPTEPDETHRSTTRRRLLATTGAGLAAGVAGCLTGQSEEEDGSDLEAHLAAVREATADYADPKAALEDGFKISGPYVPGMGWHFTHPGRIEAAAEEGPSREEPNILTYVEVDGGLELAAAEYGVPDEAVEEDPDLFADEGADANEEWHVHEAATHVFATGDGEARDPAEIPFEEWVTLDNWAEFRPPEEPEPGDTVSLNWGSAKGKEGERTERVVDVATTHPTLSALHAWVHVENPAGVFAPTNPELEGEDGHDHDQ
jgi:hypothetical protein